MSEYIKIKRRLYDELVETKAKYVELCGALELCRKVYEKNKPADEDISEKMALECISRGDGLPPIKKAWP